MNACMCMCVGAWVGSLGLLVHVCVCYRVASALTVCVRACVCVAFGLKNDCKKDVIPFAVPYNTPTLTSLTPQIHNSGSYLYAQYSIFKPKHLPLPKDESDLQDLSGFSFFLFA